MSEYQKFLAGNLRDLRKACGYTQGAVAAALGIARPTYSYYENGKTNPDIETLTKLAKMFGVSLDQLALPEEKPVVSSTGIRVKHHPAADPQTIGDLTEEEKVLIARRRGGTLPAKPEMVG